MYKYFSFSSTQPVKPALSSSKRCIITAVRPFKNRPPWMPRPTSSWLSESDGIVQGIICLPAIQCILCSSAVVRQSWTPMNGLKKWAGNLLGDLIGGYHRGRSRFLIQSSGQLNYRQIYCILILFIFKLQPNRGPKSGAGKEENGRRRGRCWPARH